MLNADLIKRYEQAKTRRSGWEGLWQEIMDYTMPGREGFSSSTPGTRRDELIFDETAVVGVQEFSSRMMSGMVPNNMRWARFMPAPAVIRASDEKELSQLQGQLDEVRGVVFESIQNSNFQQEAHESFLDLSIGTGNMVANDGDINQPLRFNSVGLHEVYLESGPFDRVDAQFRIRNPLASDVQTIWPKARITETVFKAMEGRAAPGDMGRVKILEATVRDWSAKDTETYRHHVIDLASQETLLTVTYTGIGSCPWINFRWSKAPGEVYGRGPAFNALSAIKTCNLTVQLILENAEMSIAGMWQADDDGVINPSNVRLVPGTIIPRSTNSRGLEPLNAPGNFNVADMVLKDMRHNINRALYNETLGRREGTPMSATEAAERMAELSRQVGAAYGRLQQEFVFPVIRRVVYLLKKAGRIEIPTLNGREIQITAVSPLVRAQRSEDIAQHVNYAQMLGQLFGPAAVQGMIHPQRFANQLAEWYEIEQGLLPTPDEQQEQAQQMGQAAAGAADAGIDPMAVMKGLMP